MSFLTMLKGGGREPGRTTLIARGTVFLTVTAVLITLLLAIGRGSFSEKFLTSAVVDDAGGSLVVGSDVKYDGVIVGRVTSLTAADTEGDGVRIGLDLDPELADDVPGDVTARVLPATVFGTSFLDLVGDGGSGSLQAGKVISQDRSKETLEVQSLLDDLDQVVDSLGPAELATTLEGLSGALDGNGEKVGETVEALHAYIVRLNPEMPLVRRNLELLSTNLEAFEQYAPALFQATEDALVAARTLGENEKNFHKVVDSGSKAFDATTKTVRANQAALTSALVRTAVLVDVLYDGRKGVAHGVLAVIELAKRMGQAMSYGPYVRVDADIALAEENGYGRGNCPRYGSLKGRGC